MAAKIGRWPCFLWLCVASAALVACAVVRASDSCHSFAGDALLDRVDAQFSQCLPSNTRALDAFKDALITNDLDATQHKPLAVVAFASDSSVLNRFAASVAAAFAGEVPGAHAVRVLDLAAAASSSLAAHELTQKLQHDMATALSACPQKRTLFLVRNVERVRGDKLPLLDVFLDPLNGERATLHDVVEGRDLDCGRALFVFLYQHEKGASVGTTWREFLVTQWRTSAVKHGLATEAFTPQALAGRLSMAVVLAHNEDKTNESACALDTFVARLRQAQKAVGHGVETLGEGLLESPQQIALALGVVVLVLALFFVPAKSFVANSMQAANEVEMRRATKSKNRSKKHHAEPNTARLASLRSHHNSTNPTTPNIPTTEADTTAVVTTPTERKVETSPTPSPTPTPTPEPTSPPPKKEAKQTKQTKATTPPTRRSQRQRKK